MKSLLFALLTTFAFHPVAAAEKMPAPKGVVIQANGNRDDFRQALQLAINMHEVLTQSEFEVVVFGKNVRLLSAFSDELPLIQKTLDHGIHVIACGRSLRSFKVGENDLAPGITQVPFGAVHIVSRQQQGWQYLKE